MLNRPRLIEAFRDEFDVTQASAATAVDFLFDRMAAELCKGGEVNIRHFGKLDTYASPERVGRNPRTSGTITIPAKTRVRFSAGKSLKDRVNGG